MTGLKGKTGLKAPKETRHSSTRRARKDGGNGRCYVFSAILLGGQHTYTDMPLCTGTLNHLIVNNLDEIKLIIYVVVYSRLSTTWKIIDFGGTSNGSSIRSYSTSGCGGTQGYRAPELLKDESKYSTQSDIWAIGCILFELQARRRAFPSGDWQIHDWAKEEREMEIPVVPGTLCLLKTRAAEKKLLNKMLHRNWRKRPSAQKVEQKLESHRKAWYFQKE